MISGDEVTVIYEGQLSDTDTSQTKALKVVDEFHKKAQLEERVAHVKVTGLTPNTISVESKENNCRLSHYRHRAVLPEWNPGRFLGIYSF